MSDRDMMKRYLAEEMVEDYMDGLISRRQMVRTVAQILGVATVGPALLASLGCSGPVSRQEGGAQPQAAPPPAAGGQGVTVSLDDPDITVSEVKYDGSAGKLWGYLARPRAAGTYPAVILIHENRGLTEHNRDVARRFAKTGYVALAVDLLARLGGTAQFTDTSQATVAIGRLMPGDVTEDLKASLTWLEGQSFVAKGRYGAIGWCWGGGMAWRFAAAEPRLKAAAAFYGPNPPMESVPAIRAAVLGVYAANDRRITDGKPALEEALKREGKTFEMKVYEGVDHAFFNDTGARYNPARAGEAWAATLDWFSRHIR